MRTDLKRDDVWGSREARDRGDAKKDGGKAEGGEGYGGDYDQEEGLHVGKKCEHNENP